MKNSIKRAQSQARLSFAERENQRSLAGGKSNFRPKVRQLKKTLLTLVALLAVTAGAWAQTEQTVDVTPVTGQTNQWTLTMPAGNVVFQVEYEPTYAVTFADGMAEPTKWTASPATDVTKGQTVTVNYTGAKKVIGVKAEKKGSAVKVTAITLNKTATTISAGQTETLSVSSVTPDDATDQTVTWSSDNEAVATVDADGKVTAVALGTANITATANDGSGVKATCAVTVSKVVTINQSDWGGWDTPITKDGVTVSADMIDPHDGNLMGGGTFSTTLGNFTKIVVTTAACDASGTGWSGGGSSKTWAGTPASSVSFSGNFMGMGMTQTTIVCTIEPTN